MSKNYENMREMWTAIDDSLPKLRKLVTEMESRGEVFTSAQVKDIIITLSESRPHSIPTKDN